MNSSEREKTTKEVVRENIFSFGGKPGTKSTIAIYDLERKEMVKVG